MKKIPVVLIIKDLESQATVTMSGNCTLEADAVKQLIKDGLMVHMSPLSSRRSSTLQYTGDRNMSVINIGNDTLAYLQIPAGDVLGEVNAICILRTKDLITAANFVCDLPLKFTETTSVQVWLKFQF